MKEMAKGSLFKSASVIVEETMNAMIPLGCEELPKPALLRHTVNRVRQRMQHANPKDLELEVIPLFLL